MALPVEQSGSSCNSKFPGRLHLSSWRLEAGNVADAMGLRRRAGGAQVGFVEVDASQQHPKPVSGARPQAFIKSSSQFCDLIRRRIGPAKICLQAKGTRVFQMPDLAEIEDDVANEESISLAELLQQHDVVAKKRLLLAYVLSKSFWQYYNSDWMSVRWTPRTVQFFYERRDEDEDDGAGLLDGSPYIALPAADSTPSLLSAEHLPTEAVVHRYPRLLALGMLLLDLGRRNRRGCAEKSSQCGPEQETIEERISTDINSIRRALRSNGRWPRLDIQEEARQTLRAVLDNCSNPKLFEAEPANGSMGTVDGELTIEERRAVIYRRIVHPLKSLMEKLEWVDVLGNIKRLDNADSGPSGQTGGVDDGTAAFLNTSPASDPSQPM
jgi:hypothetical protein